MSDGVTNKWPLGVWPFLLSEVAHLSGSFCYVTPGGVFCLLGVGGLSLFLVLCGRFLAFCLAVVFYCGSQGVLLVPLVLVVLLGPPHGGPFVFCLAGPLAFCTGMGAAI